MGLSGYESVEIIGELYDYVTAYRARRDIEFYVDEARAAEGRVLELGCGTGRVLIPVARAGKEITGIDTSRRMLARCRLNLANEPPEVRKNAILFEDDMRRLPFAGLFSLIMIPFRPLQHLLSVEDQRQTLDSAYRLLMPDGKLVFDVINPDPRYFVDETRVEEHEDTPETPLPDGRSFRRTGRVTAVHPVEQYSEVELIYYVRDSDGSVERLVQGFPMRWYWRYEVEHLLALSGFRVESVFGDFDRSPLIDGSPEMIFVASRARD
jgi:SAM-dependent methyltransferase